MTTQLIKIEINNFKSYAGVVRVNNLKSLNIVIGSNGSGKSNFMEAIAFSFGENKFRSRPTNIESFINAASNDERKECYVSCTFKYKMEDITFKRTLRKNRNIFTINDDIVTREQYQMKLNEIGINAKTRYFIIYQGESIESLLEKPSERAVRFEEITGSVKYKEKYEYLQKTLEQQMDERNKLNEQKKNLNKTMRYRKLDKSKETTRSELQSEYEKLSQKLLLLQLYMAEKSMKNYRKEYKILEERKANRKKEREKIRDDIENKNEIIEENERKIINLKNQEEAKKKELEDVKKILRDSSNTIKKIEQNIHKTEQDICKAKQAEELRTERIKQLEDEYQEIEKLYNQSKKELQKLSKNANTKMEEEYNHINEKMSSTKSTYFIRLNEINSSRNILRKKIDDRKKLIVKKQNEIEEINSFLDNYDKYSDQYKNLNDEYIKLKEEKVEKEKLIKSYREKEKELEQELMNIEKQLQISKSHRNDSEKKEKKATMMKSLKESIKKGVYGYLSDLCQPTHSRYEVASDVILRKYSSTIVIDTKETASLCHKIGENFTQRIKFLNLGLLKNQNTRESLRDIDEYEGIKNVKLAIDIVKYPKEIKQAVLYAFKNTLVCETPEDAFHIAYHLKSGERNNCVSLDGIYYKNNGIIFKSKPTTKKNIPDISSLKDTRNKLLAEMNDIKEKLITMTSNKIEELSKIQSEAIEKKMSFVKQLMDTHEKQKEHKEQLQLELSNLMKEEKNDQQELKRLDKNENDFKAETECYEKTYKEFYEKYNITNTSQFRDLMKKLAKLRSDGEEYINHMKKIKTALEVEKTDNSKSNLQHYQIKIDNLQKQLREETDRHTILEKEENEKIKPLELLQEELKKIEDDNAQLKKDVCRLDKQLSKLAHEFFSSDFKSYKEYDRLYKKCYKEFSDLLYQAQQKNLPLIEGSYDSFQSSFESEDFMINHNPSDGSQTLNFGPEYSIQLDYNLIANEITNNNIDSLKLMCEELKSQLNILDEKICELYIDQQWSQELEEIREKFNEVNQQVNKLTKDLMKNRNNLDTIKRQRCEKFMNGFEVICEWVKKIYKLLCADEEANAFLEAMNLEEPYLGDIQYICLPRKQKFNGRCNLSGGEKIIAMLSLVLAMLKVDTSFLLLFDEVDAPLDKVRSQNIMEYFKTLKETHQVIYATFNRNSMLYADKLIGILAVEHNGIKSSRIITLDPDNY